MMSMWISDKAVFITIADPNDAGRNCNCGNMSWITGNIEKN